MRGLQIARRTWCWAIAWDMDAVRAFVGEMDDADDPIQALTILKQLLPQVVEGLDSAQGKRAVEKCVEHLESALELAQTFPKAQFIHIVRNPLCEHGGASKIQSQRPGLSAHQQGVQVAGIRVLLAENQ